MNETEMIINPCRDTGEPELPSTGLLLINPAEAKAGLHLAKSKGGLQKFLYNSNLVLLPDNSGSGSVFFAGPTVGAPMAVLTLEKLIALGARQIIVYGWCGSLINTLGIGDILLPTWAISTEGTSAHYPVNLRPESHALIRQTLSEGLAAQGLRALSGPMWTTDAPYRESVTQVNQLKEQNILGVDMEYAALIAVAAFRKVDLSAIMLVSDELWSGKWNPGFRTKAFKEKSRNILNFLMDFCLGLSSAK
ncbi:nucleoside phosphorylase [Thermodesulfobacteriota bacterium]